MGFFDKFTSRPGPPASEGGAPAPSGAGDGTSIGARLAAARDCLDEKDLMGALAIYEEVLSSSGDRADILVTISGDLGATGNIPQIIELIAPRYDANRHGFAIGINLLQAYLAVRDADAAQHILDILFALNRPELEDRLHGFSNAIAELISEGTVRGMPGAESLAPKAGSGEPTPVGLALVSISRPIWAYGLEPVPDVLPNKEGKLRRIAFTQLSVPGAYTDVDAAMRQPEDEMGRLSRAIPLWFAETFYFSPVYSPIAALGCYHGEDAVKRPAVFPTDWTVDNIRQLVDTSRDGLDYVFTGSIRREDGEMSLVLRVWEVKKMKERKQIAIRWTPATADVELAKLHEYIRAYMEWSPYPEGQGIPYAPPVAITAWLDALAAILGLFLDEKGLLPRGQLPEYGPVLDAFAPHAFNPVASSLAWITLRAKTAKLGLAEGMSDALLNRHPIVASARKLLGA